MRRLLSSELLEPDYCKDNANLETFSNLETLNSHLAA